MVDDPKPPLVRMLPRRWCWDWRYHPSLHDHMHALGVVAANYNSLEKVLELMVDVCSNLPPTVSTKLFSTLNNNRNRIDTLKSILENDDRAAREVGFHFLRGFEICAENHNFLMHGTPFRPDEDIGQLILQKAARKDPLRTNYLHLKVQDIRTVADDIDRFDDFGVDFIAFISARRSGGVIKLEDGTSFEPTLPELPWLPETLTVSDGPVPEDGSP